MNNSSLKISDSGLNGLNSRLNQKKHEKDIEQEKLSGQTLKLDGLSAQIEENQSENNLDHTLIYNHDIDYKIYRFNGRLYRDETHLGKNFDVTV